MNKPKIKTERQIADRIRAIDGNTSGRMWTPGYRQALAWALIYGLPANAVRSYRDANRQASNIQGPDGWSRGYELALSWVLGEPALPAGEEESDAV